MHFHWGDAVKVEKSEHGSQLVISLSEEVDSGEYSCQVSTTNTIQLTHHVTVRGESESVRLPVTSGWTGTNS